jgi:hypothetical protein
VTVEAKQTVETEQCAEISGDKERALRSLGPDCCFHRSGFPSGQPEGHNTGWEPELQVPVEAGQSLLLVEG